MADPLGDLAALITGGNTSGVGVLKGTVVSVSAPTAVVSIPTSAGVTSFTAYYINGAPTVGKIALMLVSKGSLVILGTYP